MKILLVAPGPMHSTFDIFNYYLDAMRDNNDVEVTPWNHHNVSSWQKLALKYWREIYQNKMSDNELAIIAGSRAGRDLLAEIILEQPDVVFVIAGTLLPDYIWAHMVNLRNKLKEKFAIVLYLTECPYLDELQEHYMSYADAIFVNDAYSLEKYNPNRDLHIHYLPHSYNPKIHKPLNEGDDSYNREDYVSDVFFMGTPFYERGLLLSSVDWTGIDFLLGGNWADFCRPVDYLKLASYNFHDTVMDNEEVARYYQNTKISLNVHRTRGDIDGRDDGIDNYSQAYSVGPRIYESIACGGLLLTDYRKEAIDLYGDSISIYDNAAELEVKARYWLDDKNASEREEKVAKSMELNSPFTFSNRLQNIILPVLDEVLKYR